MVKRNTSPHAMSAWDDETTRMKRLTIDDRCQLDSVLFIDLDMGMRVANPRLLVNSHGYCWCFSPQIYTVTRQSVDRIRSRWRPNERRYASSCRRQCRDVWGGDPSQEALVGSWPTKGPSLSQPQSDDKPRNPRSRSS